jgi:hypothetical protein
LIRLALAAPDDYLALAIMAAPGAGIHGFGPAMGSVLLAVCRPDRFTVADSRALKALRTLSLMPAGPRSFRLSDWRIYLDTCRSMAVGCQASLRVVDRALRVGGG